MDRPFILLVHGAFHNDSCWGSVRDELREHSYQTGTVSLPSVGFNPSVKSHHEDTAVIRKELERLIITEHKQVVLVMHSYSGVPGSESVKGLEKAGGDIGGVIHCVYLTAFLVPNGVSLLSFLQGRLPDAVAWDPKEPDLIKPNDPQKFFYNDVPASVACSWISQLCPSAHTILSSSAQSSCLDFSSVPCSYLICENDQVVSPAAAKAMIESVRQEGQMWTVDVCEAGHCPWLSRVVDVVGIIERAAGET